MGSKTYTALAMWFVLVVSCIVGAYVPLHYWSAQLRNLMPQGVQLQRVSGHWWSGWAQLSVSALPQPLQLSWSMTSLFEPVAWHLNHPKMIGYGEAQLSLHTVSLWVQGLRMDAELLNPLLEPQGVHVLGESLEVSRWFSVYDFQDNQFQAFRANANWPKGRIRYQFEGLTTEAKVVDWQLQGYLPKESSPKQPILVLQSQQANPLLEMKLLPQWDVELTVMPELIEALGLRWPGKKKYPAFVMVQPLENMWR